MLVSGQIIFCGCVLVVKGSSGSAAKVPTLGTYLAAASAAGGSQLVQAVIYDLPDRDCAAQSSAGEFSIANGGAALYQAYIDAIAAQVTSTHPPMPRAMVPLC